MGTLIDLNKPVWRVSGFIPDGSRMTCFVNADSHLVATALGLGEGLISVDKAYEIDVETGLKKKLND